VLVRPNTYKKTCTQKWIGEVITAVEGGIILSQTYHTGDPLRLMAEQVGRLLQSAQS